jgi:hypothetical protein
MMMIEEETAAPEPTCPSCGHKQSVIETKGHGPACWGTPEELAPRAAEPTRLDLLTEATTLLPYFKTTPTTTLQGQPIGSDYRLLFDRTHRVLTDLLAQVEALKQERDKARLTPSRRVTALAKDMASYIHHSGYPVYDGGHTEPESGCQHPDCVVVRHIEAREAALLEAEARAEQAEAALRTMPEERDNWKA